MKVRLFDDGIEIDDCGVKPAFVDSKIMKKDIKTLVDMIDKVFEVKNNEVQS